MKLTNQIEQLQELKELKEEYLHLQHKIERADDMREKMKQTTIGDAETLIKEFTEDIKEMEMEMKLIADKIIMEFI